MKQNSGPETGVVSPGNNRAKNLNSLRNNFSGLEVQRESKKHIQQVRVKGQFLKLIPLSCSTTVITLPLSSRYE
jgi:hypothetical protein